MPESSPYTQLHIYYLEGRIKPNQMAFGKDFIGNWEEDNFSFLFFSRPHPEKVAALLREAPRLKLLDKFNMPYDEWHGGTVAPFTAGSFLIYPPWNPPSPHPPVPDQKIHLMLDPGVVFGTGVHQTTHDCLEALEQLCEEEAILSAVDVGTGTGILAIAASLLTCKRVIAVDLNLLAAKTAEQNVRLNHLEEKVVAVQGRAEDFLSKGVDLVIANIHFDVMKNLIRLNSFLRHRFFILSGLLRSEARETERLLSQLPVKILGAWKRDNIWHTFMGKIC